MMPFQNIVVVSHNVVNLLLRGDSLQKPYITQHLPSMNPIFLDHYLIFSYKLSTSVQIAKDHGRRNVSTDKDYSEKSLVLKQSVSERHPGDGEIVSQ